MADTLIKRGRSQIMFNYLPGAVFSNGDYWFQVDELNVKKVEGDTEYLLAYVKSYVENWVANNDLVRNLYPNIDEMYYFGEVEKVKFKLFPLIFYCKQCKNVHPYNNLDQLRRENIRLKCQFCGSGKLKQYPYVLIHNNGDIQPLNVETNKEGRSWKEKYSGIKMIDTRSFKTATWYNYHKKAHIGQLGTKMTSLPLTKQMIANGKRLMGGTHISDGSVYYPQLYSFVNLKQEELNKRMEQNSFPIIQIAALFQLDDVDCTNFSNNFIVKEKGMLNQLMQQFNNGGKVNDAAKAMLLKLAEQNGISLTVDDNDIETKVKCLFGDEFPADKIIKDSLLHQFIYTWYECEGETLDIKLKQAQELLDFTQEVVYNEAKSNTKKFGLQSAMLVEEFPVLTIGIGYTRKSSNRSLSVLNPFRQKIDDKDKILIPILSNKNEAIIFKLDALKVLAWLNINGFIDLQGARIKSTEQAHAILYSYLLLSEMTEEELANTKPDDLYDDKRKLATIMSFRLLHSYIHGLFEAGKAIIGLDIDSLSEYLFPTALSGAIYVSKLQGGGMGALISAFENDLTRWMNGLYEKINTCLYDPVCHQHSGACHACMFLKFSCRYFNRGLTRNMLIGGKIQDYNENEIIGYFDPRVNALIDKWR